MSWHTARRRPTVPDLGFLSRLSTGPMAGIAMNAERRSIHNAYTSDAVAIQEGDRLFVHMTWGYRHGFAGQHGMGPNLADDYWRFGGDDADVFKSIFEGRPKEMAAWGAALTTDDIWKLVYLRTLPAGPGGHGGSLEPQRSLNERRP